MIQLGYKISAEEHQPRELIRQAQRAEDVGFTFAMISDHYHPWIDAQGHSPFVWSIIGGLAQATERLTIGTGVTCPIIRIHPAIIAQAAATSAALLPGRFLFGIGTGENLNEHILGDKWPPYDTRADMLEEAVEIIRLLWEGEQVNYTGVYYTVENARLYTLPDAPPPILIAAEGPKSAELAGRIGDGLITTSPKTEVIEAFDAAGGAGAPRYAEMNVCWAKSEAEAHRTAHTLWPIAAMKGELNQNLSVPAHYEQVATMVREEDVAKEVVCGPDAERHLAKLREYIDAGFDHIWVHQIGPDQEGFFRFYEREIMPHLTTEAVPTA